MGEILARLGWAAVIGLLLFITVSSVPVEAASPPAIGVPVNVASLPPFPEGIAIGEDGNLYVSLVPFAPTSQILVLSPAGSTLRSIDVAAGPGGLASLVGEAFDAEGNLFVADFADAFSTGACGCNGRVLKISPDGGVETVASGLGFPNALAFDTLGNLYISDSFTARIDKLSPDGTLSVWLESAFLAAPEGTNPPVGVNGIAFARDGRTILAANTQAGTIVSIPVLPDGSAGAPSILASGLVGPDGIALDARGNIYVAMNFANAIGVVSPSGDLLATFVGTGDNALRNPASLAFRGRTLFITDLAVFIPGAVPGISKLTASLPGAPLLR